MLVNAQNRRLKGFYVYGDIWNTTEDAGFQSGQPSYIAWVCE